MYRRMMGMSGQWVRGEPVQVSQQWLNENGHYRLSTKQFRIEDDEDVTIDAEDDGLPDSGWAKKDITAWITENGGEVTGYNTKNKLLVTVDTMLNPPAPEPVVEEVVLEPVEETIAKEVFAEPTGDEE